MPLKLVPPRQGKSPNWTIRGTYLRVRVDQSAGTHDERVARQALKALQKRIERGEFAGRGAATFKSAAVAYADAGGEETFLGPLIKHFGDTPIANIDQEAIAHAAMTLFPTQSNATRNRCVYTPVSAVLRHSKVKIVLNRPKGAQGQRRTDFLSPDQAYAVFDAAGDPARGGDAEWLALLTLLTYCGPRVGEALRDRFFCHHVNLPEGYAYVGMTKNGEPRMVHLPPIVVAALANLPRGLDRGGEAVFPTYSLNDPDFYRRLTATLAAAGVPKVPGVAFHLFRHTYGTWMRRYAKLTPEEMVDTGVWKTVQAARRYDHAEITDVAKRADLLPTPPAVKKASA